MSKCRILIKCLYIMDNTFTLILCLILPPITSCAAIGALIYFHQKKLKPEQKIINILLSLFDLVPEKGLSHQPALWLAFTIPFLYFLAFGIVVWTPHSLLMSAEGFGNFIKISTLPLALLSLSMPTAVLVSRLHSTQQTAKQIVATQHKNNIDAFYAHRKAMAEYFSYIEPQNYEGEVSGEFEYHPRIHLKFFERQTFEKGIPDRNLENFEKCFSLMKLARQEIGKIIENEFSNSTRESYISACTATLALSKILILPQVYKLEVIWNNENKELPPKQTIKNQLLNLIGSYRYCRSYFRVICEFSGHSTDWFDDDTASLYEQTADRGLINLSGITNTNYLESFKIRMAHDGYIPKTIFP